MPKRDREGGTEGAEERIERFGAEATGTHRVAIVDAFVAYLLAIAGRDYVTACEHLTATAKGSLRRFAPPRVKRERCSSIIPKLLAPSAAAIARGQAKGDVTKVRVAGAHAFVLFHAPGAKLYEMPMMRARSDWKVTILAAPVLVPAIAAPVE